MSIIPAIKSDPVVCALSAANIAIRHDYERQTHDFCFDWLPSETEGKDPVLYEKSYQIELSYLGDNSYKLSFYAGSGESNEFMGRLTDVRIVLNSYWKANGL